VLSFACRDGVQVVSSNNNELIASLISEVRDLREANAHHKQQREYHAQMEAETARNLEHVQATLSFLQSKSANDTAQSSAGNEPVGVDTEPKYDPLPFESQVQGEGALAKSSDAQLREHRQSISIDYPSKMAIGDLPPKTPDEMKKPEYLNTNLNDVIREISQKLGRPFKVDDLIHLVYDFENEEEQQACRRSLTAGLSRAVAANIIGKHRRGIYIPRWDATSAEYLNEGPQL